MSAGPDTARDGLWEVVFDALAAADRGGLDLVAAADVVHEALGRELADGRVASRVRALHFAYQGRAAYTTCAHCDHLAGAPVAYPCDTVQMLLRSEAETAVVTVVGLWFAVHGTPLPKSAGEDLDPRFGPSWPELEVETARAGDRDWREVVRPDPGLSVVADVVLRGVPARLVLPRVSLRVSPAAPGRGFATWMVDPADAERVLVRGGLFPLPAPHDRAGP